MKYELTPKSKKLMYRYFNLKVGNKRFPCPYYQNIGAIKKKAVFVGKGLPDQIEYEANKLLGKNNSLDIFTTRLYMVMAGLGVDCSGFVSRLLDSYLKEVLDTGLNEAINTSNKNVINKLRVKLRPFTNLSANLLTSESTTIKIENYSDVRPCDLIRLGTKHVAIVTSVDHQNNKIKITYAHSTSDYGTDFGVRSGNILILDSTKPLESQHWDETYVNRNYMYEDFVNADVKDRGFRRLKVINHKQKG